MSADDQAFFTIKEFAAVTGDSPSTIRRRIADGSLPHIQFGKHKKIKIPRIALGLPPIPSESPSSAPPQSSEESDFDQISGPKPKWTR
ncbi:MAG: excisionase family DNA binding protein [Pirellulaceae bacterium]|jgi:excisionase family DNA binding protein